MTTVFLFPGQGAQFKGMLDAFSDKPVVQQTLEEASEALSYDMAALIRDDSQDKLSQTEFTQPALLTASTALVRLWQQHGGKAPDHVAGHSLGEYSALVAANAVSFSDAVKLVAFRGRSMTKAVPAGVGAMAAILGLADDVVEELCIQASRRGDDVWAANYNCPGQLVVAGHTAAVNRLMELAKEAGAKRALPLAVSAPSHTPLMQNAADAMAERLEDVTFTKPACPVWSNAQAAPKEDVGEIREALVAQLTSPVRWTETVQRLRRSGVTIGVEMGPGKVLSGLCKRIERDINVFNLASPEQLRSCAEDLAG